MKVLKTFCADEVNSFFVFREIREFVTFREFYVWKFVEIF
jgi:hypothetical protein